jgi:FG-GAP repeat
MAIVSGQVRLIVDDREAEYPVTVDPLVFSSSKLTPMNGKADDAFGFSVAISGNLAVVGAPFRETAPGVFKGAAFVFVRNNAGAWIQEAELQSSDAEDGDLFLCPR